METRWKDLVDPSTISREDLAYAAGFVDGEGSITIEGSGSRYELKTGVINTNEDVIKWFQEKFGGTAKPRPWGMTQHGWKLQWTWGLSNRQAVPFLKAIRLFLKVKRMQAALGVYFMEHKKLTLGAPGSFVPEEERRWRAACRDAMRKLNDTHQYREDLKKRQQRLSESTPNPPQAEVEEAIVRPALKNAEIGRNVLSRLEANE